jgi:hydroxymethylbilane synthase
LAQAYSVETALRGLCPELHIEIVEISTEGDRDRARSLKDMGGVGVFTKQLERALLEDRIDLAVHSAKDLPSAETKGLETAAVPEREECVDVWISARDTGFADTPEGSIVGTSSPRRCAQVLNVRPDLTVKNIRGNVETRLEKLMRGEYDALVMARAGLKRLGLATKVTEALDPGQFIPAPGQGALAIQCRKDEKMIDLLNPLNHEPSRTCFDAERRLLRRLRAGCSAAVGGWARFDGDCLVMVAEVLDQWGRTCLRASGEAFAHDNIRLADNLADGLLRQGAATLIGERA